MHRAWVEFRASGFRAAGLSRFRFRVGGGGGREGFIRVCCLGCGAATRVSSGSSGWGPSVLGVL